MSLKKYEFTSKTEYNNTIKNISTHHKPIILGKIVLDHGEYDSERNEVKPPVLSKMYCVDIYWNDNEDSSVLNEFEVFPKSPKHKIA